MTCGRCPANRTYLGIELGSTRIKAVLIDENCSPVASGSHEWENRLADGVWTYALADVWAGLQACFAALKADYLEKAGATLTSVGAMGISGMMHGYLAFDRNGELLAPFRTWRNTTTLEASGLLTEAFGFTIPQRWSIAHLYQAILNGEEHVARVARLTTLAGYVHWKLTGEAALGVGEASGMFPVDGPMNRFDARMAVVFDGLVAGRGFAWRLGDILPRVLGAGEPAGSLSQEGALLLDPTGEFLPGVPFCPPEGDAGTGMVATNAVRPRTGNVSAGTSVFAMAVLERPLSKAYPEIDIVTTPAGDPVAMVHCNNCTGEIDAWVRLFGELLEAAGTKADKSLLYEIFYNSALSGDADCGGLLAYNYLSGESVTGFTQGRPLLFRAPSGRFTLENFARVQLFSAMATLRLGMDILYGQERVALDSLSGHGGFFKVKSVGQKLMAAALKTPVTVNQSAGEGGPWGMALLASYMVQKEAGETLGDYLALRVFARASAVTEAPDPRDAAGFDAFLARYAQGLAVERAALGVRFGEPAYD